ncbi:MAG: RNA methyltransferase [Acidaminococcaceae bacterium]
MIRDIISAQNPLVKAAAELKMKKYRTQREEFLVEGVRSVQEVLTSGWGIIEVFFADAIGTETVAAMFASSNVPCYHVSQAIIERLTDTKTPQGIVAVVKMQNTTITDLAGLSGLLLVLDEVRDPGNVGTIIRTADAAGACGVVLLQDCADVYSPKVVRATMGSIFHLPIVIDVDKAKFCQWCAQENWSLWVSSLEGGTDIYDIAWEAKVAVTMGNEANGASAQMLKAAGKKVYIPMQGKAESLNVAIAAGVFLFEGAHKQPLATK